MFGKKVDGKNLMSSIEWKAIPTNSSQLGIGGIHARYKGWSFTRAISVFSTWVSMASMMVDWRVVNLLGFQNPWEATVVKLSSG